MKPTRTALVLLPFLVACTRSGETEPAPSSSDGGVEAPAPSATPAETPVAPVEEVAPGETVTNPGASENALEALRAFVTEFQARKEHDASIVKVQHLLVAFQGSGVPNVKRTKEEAELLAADLFARIRAGEDFDGLVKEYTNDSHPGIYTMTTGSRNGMVKAFGDTGWRLEVGQVGVAPFHQADSPYGWHIVKRLP